MCSFHFFIIDSHQFPVDMPSFLGTSYFDLGTTSWPLRLDSTAHSHTSQLASDHQSSPTSIFADRQLGVTNDVIRGKGQVLCRSSREVAKSDGRSSRHQSSASRNHVTDAHILSRTNCQTESSMRNNRRSTDRKFSDSGLPENQRRRYADLSSTGAPADHNTWELVTCQQPKRFIAVQGLSADSGVETQRLSVDDWRRDSDDHVRHPVWIRRHVDDNPRLTTRCNETPTRVAELWSPDGSSVDDRPIIHRDAGSTKLVENGGYSFYQRSRTTRS